jgi:hypothetical protein
VDDFGISGRGPPVLRSNVSSVGCIGFQVHKPIRSVRKIDASLILLFLLMKSANSPI